MPVFGARMVCETANYKYAEERDKKFAQREENLGEWVREKSERKAALKELKIQTRRASLSRARSKSKSRSRSSSRSRSNSRSPSNSGSCLNSLVPEPGASPAKIYHREEVDRKMQSETEKNVSKFEEYFDNICITDEGKTNTNEGKEIPFISLNDSRVELSRESEMDKKTSPVHKPDLILESEGGEIAGAPYFEKK